MSSEIETTVASVDRIAMRFCGVCDHAVSKVQLDAIKFEMLCSRCGQGRTHTDFYTLGSWTHRERREAWERGEIKGSPLPFISKNA